MLIAAFTLLLVVALAGALLLVARRLLPPPAVDQLVDRVHALLPQTQCEQCGQPGCRPYAVAVIGGEAANRCAPGGEPVARAIALLLARPILNAAIVAPGATVARIREDACIGCTRCIPVCPVDVILGATQYMHTVLEAECTGCGLCIAPCPVDCIDLVPVAPSATRTDSVLPPSGADVQASAHERAPLPPAAPCINCGKCAAACPAALQPQALLRLLDAQDIGAAARLGMSACTECGACDTVCPSSIPLRARFVAGRTAVAVHVAARHAASNAGARFARHERRRAAADDVRARKRAQRLAHRHVLATDTDND